MTIAAIYGRKSTEQRNADAEAKSTTLQVENGRAFARARGWTIAEDYVCADDAVSGADTRKLHGRQRLLEVIEAGASFHVLIMRDASRFSRRDGDEAFGELKRIAQRGIAIWFYQDGTCFEYGNFAANITGIVRAEMNAEYRRQIARWTQDAMMRKAKAGHVTGGRVFGYTNVEVRSASGERSHVTRTINDVEAAVVRRIFDLSASGVGLTGITKTLNDEGAPAPRAQRGRPTGWATSSVRDVLLRPLYRGEIVWNQTRKRDASGESNRSGRPVDEWVTVPAPELQIVSPDLWAASHARFTERQRKYSQTGRGALDVQSRYLLSGFARCATCGGGLVPHSRRHGGARVFFYGCVNHWKRGAKVCPNNLVARMDAIDAEVLATLQDDVFRPVVIEEALGSVLEELAPARQDDIRARKIAELEAMRDECDRLAEAIGRGGPLEALVARLADRQARCDALARDVRQPEAQAPRIDLAGLETRLRAKLDDWRGLLTRNITEARAVLRALLVGPLKFTPITEERRRGYAFNGTIALDRVLAGVVTLPTMVASPTGTAHRWHLEVEGFSDLRAA